MKRFSYVLIVLLLPFGVSEAAPVVSVSIGTLGPGVGIGVPLNHYLDLRVGINHWNLNRQGVYTSGSSSISYSGAVRLRSVSFLTDYSPWAGLFHVTAGMIKDDNEITAVGIPDANGNYRINGNTYPASIVGNLAARVTLKPWAPYLGFGWAHNLSGEPGFRFGVDLGVIFQGTPQVQFTASNPSGNPQIASSVSSTQQMAQMGVNKYQYYPVMTISAGYNF